MSVLDVLRGRGWTPTPTQRFLAIAVLIGAFAGLVVVCFHVTIELLTWSLLGTPAGTDRWSTLLWPALGGLAGGLLVAFVFPSARGSGVNNTRASIYVSDGYVPFSSVVGKFSACSISIGSGNPLGPEDPALQMGAGIASLLGRVFRLSREQMRLIAPVGAAAGIAAAFNTPITGVVFVIEEVLAGWSAGVLGSIVLSAVSAVVVVRAFLGDDPLFRVPAFSLTHPSELAVYAAMGLVGGLVGAFYARGMTGLRARFARWPRRARLVLPAGAGLLVGATALLLPQVIGPGYGAIDSALHDEFPWRLLLALGIVRAALSAVVFASGTPGGLFAPTLFVGAMVGGGLGGFAHEYWPVPTSPASAYVLVGMGTMFAAVFRAPMTSIFMVFEVSATYEIVLPVMVANIVAWLVSRQLARHGLFDVLADQEDMVLPSADEQRERRPRRVEDVMRVAAGLVVIEPQASVGAVRGQLDARAEDYCLVGREGQGWALLRADALHGGDDQSPVAAQLGASSVLPALYPDESIETALTMLSEHKVVPVVSRTRPPRLVGAVTLGGALGAYGVSMDELRAPATLAPATAVSPPAGAPVPGDAAGSGGTGRREAAAGPPVEGMSMQVTGRTDEERDGPAGSGSTEATGVSMQEVAIASGAGDPAGAAAGTAGRAREGGSGTTPAAVPEQVVVTGWTLDQDAWGQPDAGDAAEDVRSAATAPALRPGAEGATEPSGRADGRSVKRARPRD